MFNWLPNVAFHLTIPALEEVGKAALLGARGIAHSVEDETVFIDNRLDDHVFKLFWALWTPNFARGNVSKEEFESLRGMARSMHDDRLAALYDSPALQQEHLLRWRLAIGRLPIGHAYALESAGIDPATLRTQAQQHGKRFALAGRAMFADWLEKPSLMN